MRKSLRIIILICLTISISSIAYAEQFYMKGREIYEGYATSYGVAGATFVGNFFNNPNDEASQSVGFFTLILGHNAEGIEECGGETQLLSFKLIMNFYSSGGRLVLVGPTNGPVTASWESDDPACVNGNCPLIGYANYISLDTPLIECNNQDTPYEDNDIESAYVADIANFQVVKQWFGSWGTSFSGGSVRGRLDHTPIVSPAIVGEVTLY